MGRTCINDHRPEHSLGDPAWRNGCAQCEVERLQAALAELQRHYAEVCRENRPSVALHESALAEKDAEIERLRAEIAKWERLRDPATLHTNLVRGFPATMSRESLLHLAGADQLLNALEEADRLLDHCDAPTEWRERWAHLFEREPHTQQGEAHD